MKSRQMGFKKRSDCGVNVAIPSVSNQQTKKYKKQIFTN